MAAQEKKHKVTWEIKDKRNVLILKSEEFSDLPAACNFFRSIKSISYTKPIMEEVNVK